MNAKMKQACESVADIFEALPECWTIKYFARNSDGNSVYPSAPDAACWCSIGGVIAASNIDRFEVIDALQPFAEMVGYRTIIEANDEGGRLVAIKMLRLAAQSYERICPT